MTLIKNLNRFHNIKFYSSTPIPLSHNQFGLLYMILRPGRSVPHYPVRRCSDADTRSSDKLSGIRYIFLQLPVTCILARLILFFSSLIPVNKRSRTRLRREKVKEQEEMQEAGSRGREVESQAGGDKKETARDLVPKCQFLLPHSAAS